MVDKDCLQLLLGNIFDHTMRVFGKSSANWYKVSFMDFWIPFRVMWGSPILIPPQWIIIIVGHLLAINILDTVVNKYSQTIPLLPFHLMVKWFNPRFHWFVVSAYLRAQWIVDEPMIQTESETYVWFNSIKLEILLTWSYEGFESRGTPSTYVLDLYFRHPF